MEPIALTLRREEPADWHEVEALTREAFWNQYGPGCDEHYLVHTLRSAPAFVPELDFVALQNGRLVGSILYARAQIALDAGGELPVLTFGPLSVLPSCQRQGIGRRLVEHTTQLARQAGYSAILIFGDPAYYSRLGFMPAERFGIYAADGLYRAALQAFELQPGALASACGAFHEGEAYAVDPIASAAFDMQFPIRVKEEDNTSQRRFHEVLAMQRPRE